MQMNQSKSEQNGKIMEKHSKIISIFFCTKFQKRKVASSLHNIVENRLKFFFDLYTFEL